jgi:ketosteroid isomerase-like protein
MEAGAMGNRQVVERYARAMSENNFDEQMSLMHDDYVASYPQSSETIRGAANMRAIVESYPNTSGRGLAPTLDKIIVTDDQFVTTPSVPAWTVVHLAGSGDEFAMAGRVTYPSGEIWHAVALLTLRDGKIWREIDYFAAPFEPPEWRSPYVELQYTPAGSTAP